MEMFHRPSIVHLFVDYVFAFKVRNSEIGATKGRPIIWNIMDSVGLEICYMQIDGVCLHFEAEILNEFICLILFFFNIYLIVALKPKTKKKYIIH